MRKFNSFVGSRVKRVEDLRFLRGRGQYVDDVSCDGLLHAAILRSSVAHGRIDRIDAAEAVKRPGVYMVIAAADVLRSLGAIPKIPIRVEPLPHFTQYAQPVIAYDKVRYVGEPLAVVVADTRERAEDALDAIECVIEPFPAVSDRAEARADRTVLFDESRTNLTATLTSLLGDADSACKNAAYVRREHFRVHRHTAIPMEARGLLADWNASANCMTVRGAAKTPFACRNILATHIGLPEDAITMIDNDIGGGFGVRGDYYPEDFLIPFASRELKRPVKWVEDRREHLIATNHARDVECELEIACDHNGMILALRGEAYADVGAYVRTNGATAARNLAQALAGPYRVPNIHMDVSLLVTNKTPVGTYRGPGRFEADFFRERLFDMAARDLKIDKVEFRRRNLFAEAEVPYSLPKVLPLGLEAETDTGDYSATLDRCLAEIAWDEKQALQGKLIDGRYHGLAVGCYIEPGGTGPRETARLTLEDDGSVTVLVGSSAVGQGLETVFAQIAADELELPIGRIRGVLHGSTNYVQEGFGSFGSRSTVMGGSAVVAAARELKTTVRTAAATRLGCSAEDVTLAGDVAIAPGRKSITLAEIAVDGVSAEGTFASQRRTYSYGAHAAHVTADPKTGQLEVVDYICVEDVGRIINPLTLHGQSIGAIVQGLGGTTMEHLVYDEDGQALTGSLADYLMPTACDFPSIKSVALEQKPTPHNPLGAKGAGEGGIIPVAGVIANALAAALSSLGVEPRELPLSPPRVWQLIESAAGRRDR